MMTLSCTQKTRCDRLTAAPRTSPAWGRSWAPPRAGGFGGAVAAGPPVSGKAYSCQAVTVLQRLAFTVIADTTELDQWSAAVPFPGPGRLSASPPGGVAWPQCDAVRREFSSCQMGRIAGYFHSLSGLVASCVSILFCRHTFI